MLAKGPRLSLHDITKKFGDFTAIDTVDIELFRGEIHAIVGENGAGKSTLMRVLAGHMGATGGSMILDESAGSYRPGSAWAATRHRVSRTGRRADYRTFRG